MRLPDYIAVICILGLWFFLDGVVLAIDREDVNMYEFLTNQVWVLAIASKIYLVCELYRYRNEKAYEGVPRGLVYVSPVCCGGLQPVWSSWCILFVGLVGFHNA